MTDQIAFVAAWLLLTGAAGLAIGLATRGRTRWPWLLASLLVMAAYDAALTRGYGLIPFDLGPSDWNWEGKLLALGLSVSIAAGLGMARTGLRLRLDRTGLLGASVLSGLIVLVFVILAVALPDPEPDLDALAFQLTMPGLDEEIFYRGVLLFMLNEAFGRPVRVFGASMGWGAPLSCLAFGLAHALGCSDGRFTFDPLLMVATGGPALLLVWLRERTGSVLLPILLHNFANSIPRLI
jgi:membrane protease YdiL (CAAX protease family)